jgi:hypothetical protein
MVQLGERRLGAEVGQDHAVEKLGDHLSVGGQAAILGKRGVDLVVDATPYRLGGGAGESLGSGKLMAALVNQVEERIQLLAGEEPTALPGERPLDD